MVDFNKLLEERKAAGQKMVAEAKKQPTKIVQEVPTYWSRFQHMVQQHLGEMTGWEEQFCYSNIQWLSTIPEDRRQGVAESHLTQRVKDKLTEIENAYCDQVCHALMKANISHSR